MMSRKIKLTAGLLLFAVLMIGLPAGFGMTLPVFASEDFSYSLDESGDATITGYRGAGGDVEIPETLDNHPVVTIGGGAFRSTSNITSVTIPSSVTTIGGNAFWSCSLTSVDIPSSVTTIGEHAFQSSGLTSVAIPSSVTSIGERAFDSCHSLTSIEILPGVTTIGAYAFNCCETCTSVTLPSTVTTIGYDAFNSLPSASSVVYYNGTQDQYNGLSNHPMNMTLVFIATPNPGAGGTITVTDGPARVTTNPHAFTYTDGEDVTLTATPNDGYRFVNWTNNGTSVGTNAAFTFNATSGIALVANFAPTRAISIDGTVANRTYNGTAYNPAPVVKDGATTLTAGTHYTIGYQKQTGTNPVAWTDVSAANVKDIGTYRVVVTGKAGTDYEGRTDNKQFSITAKAVTITAGSNSKIYDGSPLYDSGFTHSPLEAGDTHTFTVVMTAGSTVTEAERGPQANVIATVDGADVTPGNETAVGNYLVTTANGTLTVTRKTLTISPQSKAFTYDGNPHSWPYYDVTGLVGADAVEATVTGTITNPNESPVENVISEYHFSHGRAGNYAVTLQRGRLTMTMPAPSPKPTSKPTPKPTRAPTQDADEEEVRPGSSDRNTAKSPDGCDELRALFSNAIAFYKMTGKAQTVTWNKGTSLPYDIMETLHNNPGVTLVFAYTYLGQNFTVTIPGSYATANPSIPWYGPIYLFATYGNGKTPVLTADAAATTGTYIVKRGDSLTAIAKRLHTTVKHLKDANNIRNANRIRVGMVLKY